MKGVWEKERKREREKEIHDSPAVERQKEEMYSAALQLCLGHGM